MLWLGTSSFAKLKEFIWGFKAFFHGAHELLRPPHSLPMLYSVGVDVYSIWFTSWNFCINHFTEKGAGSFCLCTLACSDQRMSLSHTGVNIFSSLLHQGEYSCLKIHLENRRCMHIAVSVRSFKKFVATVGNTMTFSRCTPVEISQLYLASMTL